MRISEMLYAIASWLESPNNEALLLAEYDEDCMKVVSESCVLAAALIKNAAQEVDVIEPPPESKITPESLEDLASLAAAFDASGDPKLKKQASVLDELLLSIAAPPNAAAIKKAEEDNRIQELTKKYKEPTKYLADVNKTADAVKDFEKSQVSKSYNILEAPLNTRYCPDHAGAQITRVGEGMWQCDLDKKVYNFQTGYSLYNGDKVPGSSVSNQTQVPIQPSHAIFDTRESRMNGG